MNEKRWWIGIVTGGALGALAVGGLVYKTYTDLGRSREEVVAMRNEINSSRQLLTGTAGLEREVIVLRESEEVIKEILPDEEDLNNFVRGLRAFEEESEVRITGLKKKPNTARGPQEAFEPVTYTLTLEGDAFQWLSFIDRIESHQRFMRIPSFKLSAASRTDIEKRGIAAHRIQMDVETFAYEPSDGPPPVKIEGFARKRELLLGEIARTRKSLSVDEYQYRGPRGRRDPWVDPRVPVQGDPNSLSVEEQIQVVEELVQRTITLDELWTQYQEAENVIQEMTLRSEIETLLSDIELDVARLEEENAIRFVPSQRRLQLEVSEPITAIRRKLDSDDGKRGPSIENLNEVLASMEEYIAEGEFDLALKAFSAVELRLDYVRDDPDREIVARKLEIVANQARIAADFQNLQLDIRGRALMEGAEPVVLIGGRTLGEGDLVETDLVINAIRPDEIEFIYRGVVLIRRL